MNHCCLIIPLFDNVLRTRVFGFCGRRRVVMIPPNLSAPLHLASHLGTPSPPGLIALHRRAGTRANQRIEHVSIYSSRNFAVGICLMQLELRVLGNGVQWPMSRNLLRRANRDPQSL